MSLCPSSAQGTLPPASLPTRGHLTRILEEDKNQVRHDGSWAMDTAAHSLRAQYALSMAIQPLWSVLGLVKMQSLVDVIHRCPLGPGAPSVMTAPGTTTVSRTAMCVQSVFQGVSPLCSQNSLLGISESPEHAPGLRQSGRGCSSHALPSPLKQSPSYEAPSLAAGPWMNAEQCGSLLRSSSAVPSRRARWSHL